MWIGGSGGMDPAEGPKMKEEIVEFIQKRSETNPRYADRLHACGVLHRKRARAAAVRQHQYEAANKKNKDGNQKEDAIDKVGRKRSLSCSRSQTSAAGCSRRRRRRCCARRRRRRSCCSRRRRRRSCRRRRRSRCGRRRRRSRCRRRRRRSCRRRRRSCRRRRRR